MDPQLPRLPSDHGREVGAGRTLEAPLEARGSCLGEDAVHQGVGDAADDETIEAGRALISQLLDKLLDEAGPQ